MNARAWCFLAFCACGTTDAPGPADASKDVPQIPIRDGEFVSADGNGFSVGALPLRFVGANVAMVHGARSREGTARLFDTLVKDGISVIRVWAAGEGEEDGENWRHLYAFRLGPENWIESSFAHLDLVMAEARRRNIRVILTLANRWGDYGGLPQYARWVGLEPRRKNLLPGELAHVLRSETARELYRAHARRLALRTNTVTGVVYREDPTIMSWELANELSSGTCDGSDALVEWTREMSELLRSLDRNHLISAGHTGYKTELSRDTWLRVTRLPEIGYADVHVYTENILGVTGPRELGEWLDERANFALYGARKPFILGEIGFRRTHDAAVRADWFEAALEGSERDGLSGVLVWIYRSWDERRDQHGLWAEGPLAAESLPSRVVLRRTADRWTRTPATVTNDRLAAADSDARLFPLGIEHVRPWPEGEWNQESERGANLSVDPFAFAEGCARQGEPAWMYYVLNVESQQVPSSLSVPSLGLRSEPRAHLDLLIDGVLIGRWANNEFVSLGPEALGEAFVTPRSFRYLVIRSTNDEGHDYLGSTQTALPGEGALFLRFSYPPPD